MHPHSGNTYRAGTASADEKATPKCQICRQLTHRWAKRVVKFRERNGQEAGEGQKDKNTRSHVVPSRLAGDQTQGFVPVRKVLYH